MGSSLRAGLAALAGPDPARPAPAGSATVAGSEAAGSEAAGPDPVAVVVLLVDLPGMTAPAVRRVAARAAPGALVMACYGAACQPDRHRAGHRLGHPVLLGREHWAGAAALAVGDTGARAYLQAHATTVAVVPCGDVAEDQDLDYPPR
jgi:nicotine blue oxidoreductase